MFLYSTDDLPTVAANEIWSAPFLLGAMSSVCDSTQRVVPSRLEDED